MRTLRQIELFHVYATCVCLEYASNLQVHLSSLSYGIFIRRCRHFLSSVTWWLSMCVLYSVASAPIQTGCSMCTLKHRGKEGGSNGVLFLQCFDTVGLVIWPVKVVPEMTYNVSSGTLSLYTTTTTVYFSRNYFCVVFIHSLTSLIWDTFAYSVFSLNVCMSCIHTEWPEKARTSYNSRLSGLALYLFILLMTPVDVTCDRVCWV